MAKINISIRNQKGQQTQDGKYNVKIRVTHKGHCRYIGTDYYILPDQLEDGTIVNHPSASLYNIKLRTTLNLYEKKLLDLGGRINHMDIQALTSHLRMVDPEGRDDDFFFLAEKIARDLRSAGRESYAGTVEFTITEIRAFSGSFLALSAITPEYLDRFQKSLRIAKKSANTIGIHLRNIRMIYNRAIDTRKADLSLYPFRRFKIRQAPARDRDLEVEDLRKILRAELKLKAHHKARDLFFLSFYMCGINFKDLLYAQKKDIIRGRLEIDRIKTGQPLSIKIEPEAQEIIDRYPGDKFMLGILEGKIKDAGPRSSILHKDVISQVNAKLKEIADLVGIPERLSTYHARHSWSSIAFNECGASEEIIALALGHASQRRVTAGYIRKKYDQVDLINRKVIDLLI